jgi:Mce-associated membrane protein
MFVFRSVNNIALAFFGPLFYLIPVIIYAVLKIKSRNTTLPDGYASIEKRALAFIVDLVLIIALEIGLNRLFSSKPEPPFFLIKFLVLGLGFCNLVILPSITGWSLGKRLLSIKIIKKENKKAGFFDVFYREIVKSWFSLPLLYLGCFWMLIGKRNLTWHDSVADTRVVSLSRTIEES